VVGLIGKHHVANLLGVFKANVQVHEPYYAYYLRKEKRHFDQYNSCSHEGTNYGMKGHAAPSRPMHSLQKPVDVQIAQASITCATNEASTQLMIDKEILLSDLPTITHLNNRGESLMNVQWKLSNEYKIQFSKDNEWKVTKTTASRKNTEGPILVLRHIRYVTVEDNGTLHCSCHLFQRQGFGCQHILGVVKNEVPGYLGFAVEDVSIHWWVPYYHFGERPKLNPELTLILR
jgi:hypothetical protein